MDSVYKAIEGYNEALQVDSTYAMSYYNRATALQQIGKYREAIPDYKKAIVYNFDNPSWAYSGICYSQYSLGDYKAALINADKAINAKNDYPNAYFNKAMVLYSQKNYSASLENYNKAIKYNPDYTSAYFNRALVKIALADTTGACNDFSKSSQLGYEPANNAIKIYCK